MSRNAPTQHLDFSLGRITCEEELGIEGDREVMRGVDILDEAMGVSNQATWDNILSLLADDGEGEACNIIISSVNSK